MYWQKLSKISCAELYTRLQQLLYQWYERWTHHWHAQGMTDAELFTQLQMPYSQQTPEALLQYFRMRTTPRFYLEQQPATVLRTLIHDQFPDLVSSILKAAEAVMRHEFSFLGITVQYGKQIPWNADPVSGKEWPRVFYADVPVFSGDIGYGDVKYVWELNRQQYVIDVAKAYWLTGEQKYVEEVQYLLTSWVADNPYNTGVNWANTLEPAYRALAWIWAYYFCREGLTPALHLLFLKALYQHGQYISKHLEFYSSPYNHLIGEATVLFLIGALFPEFRPAQEWATLGWQLLDTEIDNQLYRDGFTVEQASFYHYATMGFYLLAALLRKINGWSVREKIWERLERAIEFSVHLTQPNGYIPRIGDMDNARPIRLSQRALWDFREFHALGAVLFTRPDFKHSAGEYAEEALWLLGAEGYKRFSSLATTLPRETSKAFPHSGYYFMRTGWEPDAHWLCFDCGEHAAGLHADRAPSAAHGHADALSVLLTASGEPLLVDAGLYTYNGDKAWRNYFRETRAHNTVVIDGENQSVHLGDMAWACVAHATCEAWITTPTFDYVCGMHNGYRRLAIPALHRRAVFFRKPSYWLVFDEVLGTGLHRIESYFHFAPTHIEPRSSRIIARFPSGQTLTLTMAGIHFALDLQTDSREEAPESGWIGTSYGCRLPAPVVRCQTQAMLPVRWCTLLALEEIAPWHLECREGVFIVCGQSSEDRYVWQATTEQPIANTAEYETRIYGLRFALEQEKSSG